MKKLKFVSFFFLIAFFLLNLINNLSAAELVGKIVSIQGEVKIKKSGANAFQPAKINEELFNGDSIQTSRASKAALLFLDESQMILNENTALEVKNVVKSARLTPATAKTAEAKEGDNQSNYNLPKGGAWIRNKNEKFNFKINTPSVTAAIRGTEFMTQVNDDGTSLVTMLEGQVQLSNKFGETILNPGEEGLTIPGQAPTKRIIVNPEDAVQWALYYPGLFSYNDVPQEYSNSMDIGNPERKITSQAIKYLREGKALEAYNLMLPYAQKDQFSSIPYCIFGYSAMLAGKTADAEKAFLTAIEKTPDNHLAYSLLSQLYIAQNKKEPARANAEKALSYSDKSPISNLSMALVKISYFKPDEAQKYLKKSIEIDKTFVPAYIYLSKIYIGADELDLARDTIEEAKKNGGYDAEILTIAGFIRIAYRDYKSAIEYFNKAIELNPAIGEPHLGLGMCQFRYREEDRALSSFLTATLLEPRISLYQSAVAKALYELRSFDRSLEVWDYAKELDKNDPTPYFYRGVALSDLNRPGEAIKELNKSIELNDNQAIFKSKLMLDRDESVRNTSLARAYTMLGLVDWGYSKAVTAQKKDPTNSSAYLFLRDVYQASRQRTGAATSANWLYYLLSPSNQNSFSSGGTIGSTFATATDYTQMFEKPYFRAIGAAEVGQWDNNNAQQFGLSANAYGGIPGVAAQTAHTYLNNESYLNKEETTRVRDHELAVKADPTLHDSFIIEVVNSDSNIMLPTALYSNIDNPPINFERDFSFNKFNLGYTHRFNPNTTFYSMLTYRTTDHDWNDYYRADDPSRYLYSITTRDRELPFDMLNIQAHNQIVYGKHTIIGGIDYFNGDQDFNDLLTYNLYYKEVLQKNYSQVIKNSYSTPYRTFSVYLQDYFRPSNNVILEFGAAYETVKNSPQSLAGIEEEVYNSHINPFFGANIILSDKHTLRFVLQQHLQTHLLENFSLMPPDVAGFPWQLNVDNGALIKEAGISFDSQWDENTFTIIKFLANEISNDLYQSYRNNQNQADLDLVTWKTKRYMAQAALNRILTNELGLNCQLSAKKIDRDLEFVPGTEERYKDSSHSDYYEYQANLNLGYVHRTGWFSYLKNSYVYQDLKYRDNESFYNANFEIYKEFGRKNAEIGIIVNNIFNSEFDYEEEPVAFETFYPSRNIMLRLAILY